MFLVCSTCVLFGVNIVRTSPAELGIYYNVSLFLRGVLICDHKRGDIVVHPSLICDHILNCCKNVTLFYSILRIYQLKYAVITKTYKEKSYKKGISKAFYGGCESHRRV